MKDPRRSAKCNWSAVGTRLRMGPGLFGVPFERGNSCQGVGPTPCATPSVGTGGWSCGSGRARETGARPGWHLGEALPQSKTRLHVEPGLGWTCRESNPGPANRCERRLRVFPRVHFLGRAVGQEVTPLGLLFPVSFAAQGRKPLVPLPTVDDQPSPTVDPRLGWTVTLRERRRNRCC